MPYADFEQKRRYQAAYYRTTRPEARRRFVADGLCYSCGAVRVTRYRNCTRCRAVAAAAKQRLRGKVSGG